MNKENFGRALVVAREIKGWSSARLAEELKVSPNAVHKWEKGMSFPRPDKWLDIIRVIGLIPQEYRNHKMMDLATMTREDMRRFQDTVEAERQKQFTIPSPAKADLDTYLAAEEQRGNLISKQEDAEGNVTTFFKDLPLNQVPIISWVQAGSWADSNCQTTPGYAEEFVYYPGKAKSSRMFALRVKNDSMEPEFREGDIVIINPDAQAENGSYVVVKNGQEATFKQLVIDGSSVFLRPLNKQYPLIDMTGKDFRVAGVVVYKVKGY